MTARDDRTDLGQDVAEQVEALYRSELRRIVRLAYLLSSDMSFAEEAGQDAFVRLFRNWSRAREPRAYLTTVTVNLCRDRGRRRSMARTIPTPRKRIETAPELPHDLDETWQAVQLLPAHQREVVVLRFWADMNTPEIAKLLSMRPGTVRSTLHRALAALKPRMTDER